MILFFFLLLPNNLNVSLGDRWRSTCQPRLGQGCCLMLTVSCCKASAAVRFRFEKQSKQEHLKSAKLWKSCGPTHLLAEKDFNELLCHQTQFAFFFFFFLWLWHWWQAANCDPHIFTLCQNVFKNSKQTSRNMWILLKSIWRTVKLHALELHSQNQHCFERNLSHTLCFLSSCRGNGWNGFSQCSLFLKLNT